MRICAYVVIDPSPKNEETLNRIAQGITTGTLVTLTLKSVDLDVPEEKQVEFGVRQMNVDDFGQKHFNGVFYEGNEKMLINLSVPPWDEEATVKISSFPDIQSS